MVKPLKKDTSHIGWDSIKVFAYKLKRLASSLKSWVSKCLLVAMDYGREGLVSKWLSLDGL